MSESGRKRWESRPPEVDKLVLALDAAEVKFIVVGSVAAMALGVELTPGDLDIVPETSPENLTRLADLLLEIEAQPHGPFGAWTKLDSGESKWIPRTTTADELATWQPDITDADSFDHLFVTRLGNFDVVPEIAGTYRDLWARALRRELCESEVLVSHVDDLLSRLTVPRRDKDIARVATLRAIQHQLATEEGETGIIR